MKTICIIPARGGSKRIPRKNIREFCGRPIISWSISAATQSGIFDRIVVSTDDREIAAISVAAGAEVPFLRTKELSGDFVPTVPVIADTVERLEIPEQTPVCCLYATSPFVTPADLRLGFERLEETDAPFVLSVTTFAFPIQRALRRNVVGEVEMIAPLHTGSRSQDLEEAWHDAGQFYWGRAKTWISRQAIFDVAAYGLALPRHRVQDIDTEEDWHRAELMMQVLQSDTSI